VVREALRLLEERDQVRQLQLTGLRRRIDSGIQSLDQGRGIDGAAFFSSLEREERSRLQRSKGA
jgi:antitoxin ParD1/3/4